MISAVTSAVGCSLMPGGQAKLRIRNQTAATPFCRVEARGDGGRKEWHQADIPVGQEAEVTFRSGKQMICIFSCSQATDIDGQTSKTVNCKDMNIGGPQAGEIVVVDGPMKPDAGEATWENRMNPVFSVNRLKPWLTAYGAVRKGNMHLAVDHPGACPKTAIVEWEDRKALNGRFTIDPKEKIDHSSLYPPVFISYGIDPAGSDRRKAWDVPEGDYLFRVRDDCKGLDLVEQRYPEGTNAKPKRLD